MPVVHPNLNKGSTRWSISCLHCIGIWWRKPLEIYRRKNRQSIICINWKQYIRKLNRKRIRNLLSNFLTGALVDFVLFSTASVFSSSTGGGSGDMRRRYSWKASCVDVSQNIRCAAAILDIMIQWIPRLLQLASHQGPALPLLWFAPMNRLLSIVPICSRQGGIKCGNRGTGFLDSEGSHR